MKLSSILPILALAALAACGGADLGMSDEDAAAAREEAITLDRTYAPQATAAPAAPPKAAPGAAQPEFAAADTAVVPPQPGAGQPPATLNPMLIRTGTATVEVDSLERGLEQLRALAQRVGGIVGNTSITSGSAETRQATVELRIPSTAFDRAVGGLSPIGRVEQVNVSAEDVGEEFTDVTARMANARRLEARLLDLLANRTGRLEEVLNLEREIARVREEIERYEGRLRYLRTRVSVSVLTVTLHEPQTVLGRPGDRPIRDAFRSAWRNFVDMVAGLIAASGILIPLAILLYLLWRAVRWLRRRDHASDAAFRASLRRDAGRDAGSPPDAPSDRP